MNVDELKRLIVPALLTDGKIVWKVIGLDRVNDRLWLLPKDGDDVMIEMGFDKARSMEKAMVL